MVVDKYNIEYLKIESLNKPIFIFVNHKTAVLCWSKIKEKLRTPPYVVTFDSHKDFHGGFIIGENPITKESCFGSKYLNHLKHFTKCDEFLNWDLSNKDQNNKFIQIQKNFLQLIVIILLMWHS